MISTMPAWLNELRPWLDHLPTWLPPLVGAVGTVAGYTVVFLTNAGGLVAGGWVSWRD